MQPSDTSAILEAALRAMSSVGGPLGWLVVAAAAGVLVAAIAPAGRPWLRRAVVVLVALLAVGEALIVWFHWRLYLASALVDPRTGGIAGRIAVAPWTESEKLYVWALILGVMALAARRHAEELLPWLGGAVAVLSAGAILVGKPFTEPLPDFVATLGGYLSAQASGVPAQWFGAFQRMDGMRQYYYNTWYMWVHPPLLFFCYGAFVVSFAATVLMLIRRQQSFETTAYRWARLGYLPLTIGMLLGFPWALMSWQGEAWWWSGKVNMSIMMWLLYTAYLHGRLYLRRQGMWRWVAVLAVLSFAALVLTYLTTYVIPGAHSVAG